MKNHPIIKCFLIFFVLGLWSSLPVSAQQVSLSISPPLVELIIKPDKSVLVAYRVENFGDPVILQSKIVPFIPQDTRGGIRLKTQTEGPVAFNLDNANLNLQDTFFLKTRDSQQLLLRIKIPHDTPDGDYYYSFLAEAQPPPTAEGVSSSRAKTTIGSNILITVTQSGKIDVKGKVALFDVLSHYKLTLFGRTFHFFDSNDKIPVVLIVENKGRNLLKPQGEIILKGNFGEKASFDIVSQNILAESQRLITATPSASVDSQNSLVLAGFFIGRYLLSTTLNFGERTSNIFAQTSFIALPFKMLIGLLTAVIIGVILIRKILSERD